MDCAAMPEPLTTERDVPHTEYSVGAANVFTPPTCWWAGLPARPLMKMRTFLALGRLFSFGGPRR